MAPIILGKAYKYPGCHVARSLNFLRWHLMCVSSVAQQVYVTLLGPRTVRWLLEVLFQQLSGRIKENNDMFSQDSWCRSEIQTGQLHNTSRKLHYILADYSSHVQRIKIPLTGQETEMFSC